MARTPIHPGETLRDDLDALGMSAAELARQLAVPVNRITQILNGTRAVTGDTALRLGHFFNTSPDFWLNLQKLYELRLAELAKGDEVASLPRFDAATWQRRSSADQSQPRRHGA
jgi:antitoxin HigA-1